jgi:hypothetical protein
MRQTRAVSAALVLHLVTTTVAIGSVATPARAQELEPRAYSPSPVGTTFAVVAATRSAGDVLTDPTLPLEDVEAKAGVLVLGGGHVFAIAGRQASILGVLPITWLDASGEVGDNSHTASRRGLSDPRIKMSMILAGARAMRPAEFAKTQQHTIVGVSLTVGPPLGQYDRTRLVNLGANRWSFKPEVGVSRRIDRWTIEGYAGVWMFTTNHEFYTGSSVRRQDPILSLQGHVSYALPRRAWVAFNGTWYTGGRSNLDGVDKLDLQRSTRLGTTLSLPLTARQSIKVSYSAGAQTRIGGDFRTIGVSWQKVWF